MKAKIEKIDTLKSEVTYISKKTGKSKNVELNEFYRDLIIIDAAIAKGINEKNLQMIYNIISHYKTLFGKITNDLIMSVENLYKLQKELIDKIENYKKSRLDINFKRLMKILKCNSTNITTFAKMQFKKSYSDKTIYNRYILLNCNNSHCLKCKSESMKSYLKNRVNFDITKSYFITISSDYTNQMIDNNKELLTSFKSDVRNFLNSFCQSYVSSVEYGSFGDKAHIHSLAISKKSMIELSDIFRLSFNKYIHIKQVDKDTDYLSKILPYQSKVVTNKEANKYQYIDLNYKDFMKITAFENNIIKQINFDTLYTLLTQKVDYLNLKDFDKNDFNEYLQNNIEVTQKVFNSVLFEILTDVRLDYQTLIKKYQDKILNKNTSELLTLKEKENLINKETDKIQLKMKTLTISKLNEYSVLSKFFTDNLLKYEILENDKVRCYCNYVINDNIKKRIISNVTIQDKKSRYVAPDGKELFFTKIENNLNFNKFANKLKTDALKKFMSGFPITKEIKIDLSIRQNKTQLRTDKKILNNAFKGILKTLKDFENNLYFRKKSNFSKLKKNVILQKYHMCFNKDFTLKQTIKDIILFKANSEKLKKSKLQNYDFSKYDLIINTINDYDIFNFYKIYELLIIF